MNQPPRWLLLVFCVCVATLTVKAQPAATATVSQTEDGPNWSWAYTFTFTGLQTSDTIAVRLPLNGATVEPREASRQCSIRQVRNRGRTGVEWTFDQCRAGTATITIVLTGRSGKVVPGTIEWIAQVNHQDVMPKDPTLEGPVGIPSGVRPMFGAGVNLRRDDFVDFRVSEDTLLTVNDSRTRPEIIAGLLFNIPHWNNWDILASMEFTEDGPESIDGFLLGLGWRLGPQISLVFGYSLRQGQELSYGFRREAARVVAEQQALSNPSYERFELNASGTALRRLEMYDGLPLTDPATGERFFDGAPLVDSSNHSITVGVIFPVNVKGPFKED